MSATATYLCLAHILTFSLVHPLPVALALAPPTLIRIARRGLLPAQTRIQVRTRTPARGRVQVVEVEAPSVYGGVGARVLMCRKEKAARGLLLQLAYRSLDNVQ